MAAAGRRRGSVSGEQAVDQMAAQLKVIKHVHKQLHRRFKLWWAQQDQDERTKFMLEWCPYMPLAPGKPYMVVDGKQEDLRGMAMMAPELNQQELFQGDRLMQLLREIAEVPGEADPGGAPGYDAFTELCLRNVEISYSLVDKVKTSLSPQEYKQGIVYMLPGEKFGQTMVVKQMVPTIKQMLAKGAFIPAPVFEALQLRLNVLLSFVAGCLDHFRVQVLGKGHYKAIAPQLGCARCGAVEAKDNRNGRLQACSACGVAFYCSKECQRADWRAHKPECKPQAQPANKDAAGDAAADGAAAESAAAEGAAGDDKHSVA